MPSDADRFRPRDQQAVAEQSPPTPQQAGPSEAPPQSGPPQHELPQYEPPQHELPQYQPPQYAPPQYALPSQAQPPYASFDGRDAPLIHPAAAQASNLVPYGVPVYQAPAYGYLPHPARGLSITALVLGICSFVFAWTLVVVPIIGIVFGFIALRREPAGKAMAVAGLITSAIGLLWVLLFYLLPFGLFFGSLLLSSTA